MSTLEHKLKDLRHWMRQWDSALVAYSGGVDSALVMMLAHEQLGAKSLACIGVSPSYPSREMRDAVELAKELGAPYRLIDTEEHLDDRYLANAEDRCFFCKDELYGRLRHIADSEGWQVILDGTNYSDVGDDRPGMLAAHQQGVRSPLLELRIDKEQVRELARHLSLEVWDKPAMACLSSRVPRGTPITPELLRQIEQAEDVLVQLGFAQFRVRHHGELARIELSAEDLPRAVGDRDRIVEGVTKAGYRFVCLDLAGFRSGSLNPPAGAAPVPLTIKGKA